MSHEPLSMRCNHNVYQYKKKLRQSGMCPPRTSVSVSLKLTNNHSWFDTYKQHFTGTHTLHAASYCLPLIHISEGGKVCTWKCTNTHMHTHTHTHTCTCTHTHTLTHALAHPLYLAHTHTHTHTHARTHTHNAAADDDNCSYYSVASWEMFMCSKQTTT